MGLVLALLGGGAMADICDGSEPPVYPLEELLFGDGLEMSYALFPFDPSQPLPVFNEQVWDTTTRIRQPLRDVLLLTVADATMVGGMPLDRLVTIWPEPMWQAVMEALERHGLSEQKAALAEIPEILEFWEEGPEARTGRLIALWSVDGPERRRIEAALSQAMERFVTAEPTVRTHLVNFIESDPSLAERYAARRMSITDEEKLRWLEQELMTCFDGHPWTEGAPLPFGALDKTRRDVLTLAMLRTYLAQDMLHFLYRPEDPVFATVLPMAAEAMDRSGLAQDADVLARALSAENREAGLDLLRGLNAGRIQGGLIEIAKDANLWPQ
ncbi:hypothetical protein ACN2XU_16310 [Primorskyibacter sp. 2E107]|uniref:hypothetical protein n=1 Tax=Primorskyibacter sp. 2E107 TaxID=3403458 RepID=UPI003AF79B9C